MDSEVKSIITSMENATLKQNGPFQDQQNIKKSYFSMLQIDSFALDFYVILLQYIFLCTM